MPLRIFFIALVLPLFAQGNQRLCRAVEQASATPLVLTRYAGKTGYIYDTTASARAIGPGDRYEGQTYGAAFVQEAIRRYLPTKDFQDGTLDIFVGVRVGDPDPGADLSRIYEVATFFGSSGREVRGMARNPEAKRSLRIFLLEGDALGGDAPERFIDQASRLADEFGVDVAITSQYVTVPPSGVVSANWLTFPGRAEE